MTENKKSNRYPNKRFPVLEGDKLMKEVLNGGYNVHPVPPPNSEIKDRIRNRYERDRINIEKLLLESYQPSSGIGELVTRKDSIYFQLDH